MARFDTSGLDDVLREMTRMGEQTGDVAQAMILTGAYHVRNSWIDAAVWHGHHATGDMIESIGYARYPSSFGEALYIDIYPQGKDRKGVRNAEKAFILHYGSSKLQGSRWVDLADEYSEETAIPAMREVWEEYIETGKIPEAPGIYQNKGILGMLDASSRYK